MLLVTKETGYCSCIQHAFILCASRFISPMIIIILVKVCELAEAFFSLI